MGFEIEWGARKGAKRGGCGGGNRGGEREGASPKARGEIFTVSFYKCASRYRASQARERRIGQAAGRGAPRLRANAPSECGAPSGNRAHAARAAARRGHGAQRRGGNLGSPALLIRDIGERSGQPPVQTERREAPHAEARRRRGQEPRRERARGSGGRGATR